jgi:TetR/AcrR family transcriptional regulator
MDNMTLTRKEKEKIKHREEIIRASLKLFSEKGFHSVSMQDIAARAEFSVGTLYNFFQSKEQLFTELLNDCAEKTYQLLSPILESEKPEDAKLRTFIRAHSSLAEDNIEFIKLYVSEYGNLIPAHRYIDEQADKVKTTLYVQIEDVIASGIRKKIFRSVEPKITAQALAATLQSFVLDSSRDFEKSKVDEGLVKIEQLFIDTLLMPENKSND